MENLTALGAGVIAGLALAVPLGAIGVLLVQEGSTRGWVRGAPAAVAVATVDMLYGIATVSAGAFLAPVISSWGPWPKIIGGLALVALAIGNLTAARHRTAETSADSGSLSARSSLSRFALFFALTAVNPATLIYFAAVVTGLSSALTSESTAALFIVGVSLASLSWQLSLVFLGAAVRRKVGPRFGRLTTLIGSSVVGLLGAFMIAGAIF